MLCEMSVTENQISELEFIPREKIPCTVSKNMFTAFDKIVVKLV